MGIFLVAFAVGVGVVFVAELPRHGPQVRDLRTGLCGRDLLGVAEQPCSDRDPR